MLTTTGPRIEGYRLAAYKGIARGSTWRKFLRDAEEIGANAILNTRFDDALDVDSLFHGCAVVVERERSAGRVPLKPKRWKPRRLFGAGDEY